MRTGLEFLPLQVGVENFPSRIVELFDRCGVGEITECKGVVLMQYRRSAMDGVEQDDIAVEQSEPEFDRLVDGLEDTEEERQVKRKAVLLAQCMQLRDIHMRTDIKKRVVVRFEEMIRMFSVPLFYVKGCVHDRA